MLLNLREYHRPGEGAPAGRQREDLDRALALLARSHIRTVPLAGGTSILASADPSIEAVVDLSGMGLAGISSDGNTLSMGALATRGALTQDPTVRTWCGGQLSRAAHLWGGSVQRNRATLGGALAMAAWTDPLVTVLLAADAQVVLHRASGSHQVPLVEFLERRPGFLASPAIITGVLVTPSGPGWALCYTNRTPLDEPIVVVAAHLERQGDHCVLSRIALGGCAEAPMRAQSAERRLAGARLDAALCGAAAVDATAEIDPPSDVRGTSDYRRALASVLVERALLQAWEIA